MLQVEITKLADADFDGMLEYGVEMFGWAKAEAYVASFDDSFALVARYPEIGVLHPEFRPPIRSLPHGSHRIFYDFDSEKIVIQRILHKSMDVPRWLG